MHELQPTAKRKQPKNGTDFEPQADRPKYDCPECGHRSMQFFEHPPKGPHPEEKTNAFLCFACGRSWEV